MRDLYGVDVSADLVSAVTDAVLDEIAEWQNRPLERLYALVFFDAIRVKVRDEGMVRNKAVYVALGVRPDGTKEILGLWIEQTEGAKSGPRVMNELKNRGVEDVQSNRRRRWPEGFSRGDHRGVSANPGSNLHRSPDPQFAGLRFLQRPQGCRGGAEADLPGQGRRRRAKELNTFAEGPWGRKYPAIAQSWRRHWSEVIPFFAFPDEVRRIIYTTNAIESLNAKLRRTVRARGHFPTDESALKLLSR